MTNKTIQHLLRRITALLLLHNRILSSASSLWNKLWSFILGHIKRRPLLRLGSGQTLPHRKDGGTKTSPPGELCWIAPSTLPAFGLNFTRQTHEAYLGSNSLNADSQATGSPTGGWADGPPESDTTLTEDITDNDSIWQYAHFGSMNHAPETITNFSLTSKSEISAVIYPTMPAKLSRYKRKWAYDPEKSPDHALRPLQHDFSDGELPAGWEQFIHPEGGPFFWNREQRIVTDSWLYDREIFRVLTEFITQIDEFIRSRNLEKTNDVDLVLELVSANDEWWCGYYFVQHSTRLLFWLESYIISEFLKEVKGDLSPSHIELQLQCQYWNHWSLFPNVTCATSEVMNLLTDAIRDAQTDLLTSKESTINSTPEELRGMMEIVNDAKAAMNQGENCSTWFVGRFMSLFWEDRFRNFYGQRGARLSRKDSIHGRPPSSKPTSYLFKILSPILFCAPDVHLMTMEELWVDKLTVLPYWTELFNKLNQEWMGHTVYASILLNANVAFLALPSNDPATVKLQGSPVEIACFLSIVTSVASIMLGLLLCRQHQTRERGTVDEVCLFLTKRNHRTRGLETLSIMYSLPYALLMWAMVTFLLAFSIMCFQNTSALARYIVGVAWVLNAVLVAWCIRMSWEETENRWWSLYKGIWKKFVEGAHSLVPVRCNSSDSHGSVDDDERASVVESTPSVMKVKTSWFKRLTPQSSQPAV